MKIAINLVTLTPGKNGGMEIYTRSMIEYLVATNTENEIYLVGYKLVLSSFSEKNIYKISIDNYLFHNTNRDKVLKDIIKAYDFDVWFSPMLSLNPIDCPIPSAICIPDAQHLYHPEFFDKPTLEWRNSIMKQSIRRASIVFTLSANSKADLIKFYKLDPNKVVVTYLDAPSWVKKQADTNIKTRPKSLPEKYLYYPANTWPHKNHLTLIKAFSKVVKTHNDLTLVLTGDKTDNYKNIDKLVTNLNLKSKVKFLGYLDKNEVVQVYKYSLGLIYPTLFEGFGIPLIEAFNLKIPVLCSKHNTSHEVAGNAVLYFDPKSIADLKNKMTKFLENKKLRKDLVKKGLLQARKFDYQKASLKTMNALRQISLKRPKTKSINSIKTYPKISIIMPSFNQGEFIEESILSVLNQDYPNLEFIVMDGGSTDKTVSILKKYSKKILWVSEKDKGQTDAINKGLKLSTGDIIAYLNSDDLYEPGALRKVAYLFNKNKNYKVIYGKGKYVDTQGKYMEDYPSALVTDESLFYECNICQPSVFFKREVYKKIGSFDPDLQFTMDYDYWLKVIKKYKFRFVNEYLSSYRIHSNSKTVSQQIKIYLELIKVSYRNFHKVSYNWIIGYFYVSRIVNSTNRPKKLLYSYFVSFFLSFFYYLYYNRKFPEKRVLKIYLSWLKHSKNIFFKEILRV